MPFESRHLMRVVVGLAYFFLELVTLEVEEAHGLLESLA